MSERSHHHNPAAYSRSRLMRAKRVRSLSNSSARSNCEPHDFIRLRTSAAVGPEWREADDCPSFLSCPLYCGHAGSDVKGCRRPTGGVFICMLQTRVTLTAFPIATPRGRSSKFPWRELLNYSNVSRCNWLPPPLKITYCIPTLTKWAEMGSLVH